MAQQKQISKTRQHYKENKDNTRERLLGGEYYLTPEAKPETTPKGELYWEVVGA
jgi:hypothetical protein